MTYLALDPREDQVDSELLVCRGECDAKRDAPPLVHTAAAARRRRVLGLEHGMPPHRRLSSVIARLSRREPLAHEILGMATDNVHALLRDILAIRIVQREAAAELRLRQTRKCQIKFGHFLLRSLHAVGETRRREIDETIEL